MKVKQIAAAGMIFCLVCAVASVWLGRFTGENVAFMLKYRQSLPKIEALKASVSRIPSGVNVESLKAETEKAKYDATKLSVDISGEMSRFGMVVMDVSVKQVSGNEVSVSIKGMVPADRLYDFVLGVSSIDKLFFVRKFETSPRNSPVQIISRLDQIRNNPKQLQALKSDLKGAADVFNVSMEVLVVTS